MLILNLLISVAGLTLVTAGLWAVANEGYFLRMLAPFSRRAVNASILCATLGAGLLVLGLLGCSGAVRGNKCLLLAFFSVLAAVFVANVASGVVVLAYPSLAEEILQVVASATLREDYGSDPLATAVWNATMGQLACCGYSGFADFPGPLVPPPCCRSPAPCGRRGAARSGVPGCSRAILRVLAQHANVVGGVTVGVGALEIAAMMVSMFLYCQLEKQAS
ncbi:tetraspanin-1 [Salarias fasciatus]|uniref:tetraspanin-1 n=1 Tax=Salarias fasciatus TaxID=181472 RepID=UPI001176B8C4|nr:tetraspanin-1-like [Salarias fasciatus]